MNNDETWQQLAARGVMWFLILTGMGSCGMLLAHKDTEPFIKLTINQSK